MLALLLVAAVAAAGDEHTLPERTCSAAGDPGCTNAGANDAGASDTGVGVEVAAAVSAAASAAASPSSSASAAGDDGSGGGTRSGAPIEAMDAMEVVVSMCADFLHSGHINLLEKAAAYGRVTVWVMTDEAMELYKRRYVERRSPRVV